MKKITILLMLLLCTLCLTGCMTSLVDKTYYTTDTVEVVLKNQMINDELNFSEADLLAADEVALEGSISIFQDVNEVIVVSAADIVISSVSAPPDVSADEASITISVPYEDLELNTTYAVRTDSRLTVVLKKDGVEQNRVTVTGLFLSFTPTLQYGEPTPTPTPTPTPEPTPEPTAVPTAEPTPEPTAVPTAEPTPEPTAVPTAEPTPEPEWNLPHTGDDSFVSLWLVFAVASILGLGMMACKRKSA